MTTYISGPMTGMPNSNYDAFCEAEERWCDYGYDVHNPAREERNKNQPWEVCMRNDLEALLKCDTMVMLNGWKRSKGARLEHAIAHRLNMVIFNDDDGMCNNDEPYLDPDEDEDRPLTLEELTIEPEAVTQEAHRLVTGDRRAVYGHPLDDYTKTAKIMSGILGIDVTPEQAILCMIGVKLSRLVNSPNHRDSIVDVAGYAECLDLVRQERITREKNV
jgi:hypothetical protein